jgi:hypothetical protein
MIFISRVVQQIFNDSFFWLNGPSSSNPMVNIILINSFSDTPAERCCFENIFLRQQRLKWYQSPTRCSYPDARASALRQTSSKRDIQRCDRRLVSS